MRFILQPCVGFGSEGIAHEVGSFAMAREVEIEAARRVALHVLPEAADPADVRIVVRGLDQIASRLSMKGMERSPKAVASAGNTLDEAAEFPDRSKGHFGRALRQPRRDLLDDIVVEARKIGRFPVTAVAALRKQTRRRASGWCDMACGR